MKLYFFDYMYYRIHRFYKVKFKDNMPGLYSTLLLAFMVSTNVIMILHVMNKAYGDIVFEVSSNLIQIFVLIVAIISIRYYVVPYEKLNEQWSNEDYDKSVRRGRWLVLYFILSLPGGIAFLNFWGR